MKKFWKVLGFTALAAALTPYRVEKNEETGEKSYQALLWRITSAPSGEDEKGRKIGISLGEGTLTSKLVDKMDKSEEPHLFSDEISIEYNITEDASEQAESDTAEAEAEVEMIGEAVETSAAETGEDVQLEEQAAEKAEPAAEAEENKPE